jgi:hypothetical protein
MTQIQRSLSVCLDLAGAAYGFVYFLLVCSCAERNVRNFFGRSRERSQPNERPFRLLHDPLHFF